ncbi:uncharacterized protein LOC112599715 [Melanaphis sacchari]|uniref:uncharacterized protein LOC112599715 n=1 Tax=Melanaphis sacchari TaxID=742174 RepID=UPI000DC12FC3|nr:uncharacterized protein LOC112599715 [Melanaphis sacchari]
MMSFLSSSSDDLSQSPRKYYLDRQHETIDTNNHENHDSSKDSRDGLLLDMWRTCPVAIIRSNPVMRIIYDRGFVSGFFRHNSEQSTVTSVVTPPTESTKATAEVISSSAKFASPSDAEVVTNLVTDLTDGSALDNAIESALDNAVEIAEASKTVAFMAQTIFHHNNKQP